MAPVFVLIWRWGVGLGVKPEQRFSPKEIFGKKIFGFSGNDVSLEKNFKNYIKIIKKINFKQISNIFSIYKFKNINEAILDFKKGTVLRPLIKF